jgi:hypothetical protein
MLSVINAESCLCWELCVMSVVILSGIVLNVAMLSDEALWKRKKKVFIVIQFKVNLHMRQQVFDKIWFFCRKKTKTIFSNSSFLQFGFEMKLTQLSPVQC